MHGSFILTIMAAIAATVLAPGRVAVAGVSSCGADLNVNGAVELDDLLLVIGAWGPCPARPKACPGDIAPPGGDQTVNISDLMAVIVGWGQCPTGSCWLPGNSCSVNAESQCAAAGGSGWVLGATCVDTDGDRIPDAYELADCSPPNLPFVGTSPGAMDTDGDRLNDGDEFYGTLNGLDLPGMGASPLRKNLMMEVDWFDDATDGPFHTHRPTVGSINAIIASFANSPVTNTCGGTGITFLIDYGQGGAFTGGNLIPGGDTVVLFDSEYNGYKAANFAANRNGYFYYSIHAHRYNSSTNNSSGIAEINGDDHMVTLNTFLNDSAISKTIMHELGHNLNLRHGGNQDLNYKPNYNSVMNYRFQFGGADSDCNGVGNGVLNYSLGVNPPLNESALTEAAGICGAVPIDWNGNAIIDASPITRNINCSPGGSSACGAGSGSCVDTVCQVLNDNNDWLGVVFTGLSHFDFAPPEIVTCDAPIDVPRDQ